MRKRAEARQRDVVRVLSACDGPMTAYKVLERLQTAEADIAPSYRTPSSLTDQSAFRADRHIVAVHGRCESCIA